MSAVTYTEMTVGALNDCSVDRCLGVAGGLCALLLTSANPGGLQWCCTPYAANCWRWASTCQRVDGNITSNQVYCSSGTTYWCCIAEFEGCPKDPTQMGVCMPKNSPNPALSGPLSISDSPANTTTSSSVVSSQSSTPTPTPTPAGSSGLPPGAAAAAGAGGVVVFFTIAIGLYFFLKRKPREPREPPSGAVDMATQDNAREIQGVAIHELGLEGANKGTGVHELGLGETNKQGW